MTVWRFLLLSSFVGSGLAACNTPRNPHAGAAGAEVLPWIEDDYPRALAEARASGRPLFVDAWAPWCHTCASMREFVFTDRAMAPLADRFVWLAIDTEKQENAPVLGKLPVTVWPTLFVVDPRDETVKRRWLGSATVPQLRELLADGERAVRAGGSSVLAQADAAALAKDWRRAAELYGQAGDRPEALVPRIEALWRASDVPACLALGREAMEKTGNTQSAIDFASMALNCAEEAKDLALLSAIERRLSAVLAEPNTPIAFDDRGAAWQMLWDLREAAGDKAGAERAAESLLRELGEAARKAPDPKAAATFNWARTTAYLYLGRGDEAIAMLEAAEKALPGDYNPPHHQARVYRDLGRFDEALAALERALLLAYGPRTAGFLGVKADVLEKKGDLSAAAAAYQAQVAAYEALPAEQRPPGRLEKARADATRLGALSRATKTSRSSRSEPVDRRR